MAVIINGNGIDMGNNPVSNVSQVDSTVINENGDNVATISNLVGFKNYIINGNFDIWQRGTSFTGLTNGSYSADRWVVYDSVGDINYNVVRNAGIFTGGYGASYTWNSGTGQTRSIIQFIENVTRFKVGSSVTVSFEAYTNSTPYSINVAIQGVRGTWASATSLVSSPIALTNTKTKYSVTLSVPDWSSLGIDWAHLEDTKLALKFDFGVGTNGKDFIISNVQLEEGSVATPFENRPIGLELSLCQRYYETCYPAGIARGTNLGNTPFAALVWRTTSTGWFDSLQSGQSWFRVPKRVTPTMAYWDGAGNSNKVTVLYGSHNINVNVGSPFSNLSTNGFYSDVNVNANSVNVFAYWEASAEL